MRTRFSCSGESRADRQYKDRVVSATAEDTLCTQLSDLQWPDAAHRVLRSDGMKTWEAAGSPPRGSGQSCSLIEDVQPAADLVATTCRAVERILAGRR